MMSFSLPAQLQEFLASNRDPSVLESLQQRPVDFNDIIDMFTQQTGIDPTLSIFPPVQGGSLKELQRSKQNMNGDHEQKD
jgi:hypothetical protein